MNDFMPGKLYRRSDLHRLYGGQRQGGISDLPPLDRSSRTVRIGRFCRAGKGVDDGEEAVHGRADRREAS